MAKSKLSISNALDKEPTRSMLNLLCAFHNKGGLEAKHFRYALQEIYATPEQMKRDLQIASNVNKMDDFFGYDEDRDEYFLDILYENDEIVQGCIKGRSHLDYYLNLLSNELKIIDAINKNRLGKVTKYILNQKYFNELNRMKNIGRLNSYKREEIMRFDLESPKTRRPINLLYGISKDMFDDLNQKEKKEIKKHLVEIEKHLNGIEDIKTQHLEKTKKAKKNSSKKEIINTGIAFSRFGSLYTDFKLRGPHEYIPVKYYEDPITGNEHLELRG